MVVALAIAASVVMAVGPFGFGYSGRTSQRSTVITDSGPDTLEELFAARYARGDIDRFEYLSRVDNLARQLHYRL